MIYKSMNDLIGNTPMLEIPANFHGLKNIDLYIKLEFMNPYGSIKDRTAWALIKDEIEDISKNKKTIFENSSGNTAKALAALAAPYDVSVKLMTAPFKTDLQKHILYALGIDVEEIAGANDCFDPNNRSDPQYLVQKIANENPEKVFFPSQFTNSKNTDVHYNFTGKEILDDLSQVDFFFGGLGTLGSSTGVIKRLREANPKLVSIGVASERGSSIPGIRSKDHMIGSPLFNEENYKEIISVSEMQALDSMLLLNRRLGILCGPSTGANYYACLAHLSQIDENLTGRKKALLFACDRLDIYMDYIRERKPDVFGEKFKPDSFMAFNLQVCGTSPQITVEELPDWIKKDNPLIIDIRSPMAFKLHKVPGSLNIPQEIFDKLLNQTDPFPKDKSILLICAVGERTQRHATYLQSKGYKAYSLAGGIQELVDHPELLAA